MAIRHDADGDVQHRSTGLPGITAFTFMGWVLLVVDEDVDSYIFSYGGDDGAAPAYLVGVTADGTTFGLWNGAALFGGTRDLTSRWHHLAMTVAGTGAGQFLGYVNGRVDVVADGSTVPTNTRIIIGNFVSGAGGAGLNCRVAAVKIYAAVLTAQEIEREAKCFVPIRTANINAFYPMIDPDVADNDQDESGQGNHLTQGGTLTTEFPGPPIPWSLHSHDYSRFPKALLRR